MTNDLNELSLLGRSTDEFRGLEAFPNRNLQRDYTVTLSTDEFTCVCPKTGQPDFATVTITYIPDKRIVESKSLKLYFQTYRNRGVFHEHVTNMILDDLVEAIHPRWCRVQADFGVRGGISITVEAEYTGDRD
ncbi:MAG: NADPH-dependent 7-cyano-7-deazaguanine reductase QueF [Gemmatimonadaceae bacterium 4484_173]|nr:MAG: NADPH-dependent 7-cyano-7-deazaguanine reductase QueF [Gemmatimonadaceae bacterium 4484_173]RKZ04937.1 MAG: NADPH-dependent 7-cyano-7-deazaguanine reductase QueF [Candidatus Fermentibacteria bacterium]